VYMPTGAGKTMCFWIPPLLLEEKKGRFQSVVIVSPLLALMNQQAKELKECGLKAQVISSETGNDALTRVKEKEIR